MNIPDWIHLSPTSREEPDETAKREVTVGIAYVVAKWALLIGTASGALLAGMTAGWLYALIPVVIACGLVLLVAGIVAMVTVGKM